MQHSIDLYQKMKNSSTPEDMEKWAMERKKRFPTKANIELRKEEELEKIQRGEVIKQNTRVQIKTKRSINIHERKRKLRKRQIREIESNCSYIDETYRGLHPFSGTSILEEDSTQECSDKQINTDSYEKVTDNISDEDDVPQTYMEFKPAPQISLPAFSLVANYESDEDKNEAPEEVLIQKIEVEDPQNHIVIKDITVLREISNDVSPCIVENNKSNDQTTVNKIFQQSVTEHQDKSKHGTNQIVKDKRYRKDFNRHSNILLQKLLARPVQQERNFICQCLKYIVDNNFFEIY